MADWDEITERLRAVAERGDDAWGDLLALLDPALERLARFQPIGRLRADPDAHRDIVTRVFGRLRANQFRAIKKLFAADKPPVVRAWIRVLVRSAAIDFLRAQPEFVRGNATTEAGWISLDTLGSGDAAADPASLDQKRREVTAFLAAAIDRARELRDGDDPEGTLAAEWGIPVLHTRRLIKQIDRYGPVLAMVMAGHSYPAIAEELDISRREVELTVSYIEQLLWARGFATSAG